MLTDKILNELREQLGLSKHNFEYRHIFDPKTNSYENIIKGFYGYEEIFIELYPKREEIALHKESCEYRSNTLYFNELRAIHGQLNGKIDWALLRGE